MNLMLDFETLGNDFSTMVVSLGAVAFNRSGIVAEKLWEFELEDQVRLGRTFTASTLAWWMKQSDKARSVFHENEDFKVTVSRFLPEFNGFCDKALATENEGWDQLKPWGNGANFDIVIIEDLFRRHHERHEHGIPWKFWNVRCFRTFNELTGCKDLVPRPHGTAHSALDDARYQAKCVLAVYEKQDKRKARRK